MRRAARGVLVIHHDPVLNGSPVRQLSKPPLPSLAVALNASAGGLVDIELKTDGDVPESAARALCSYLRRRNGRDRVLASSFDPRCTAHRAHAAPRHPDRARRGG